jgi:hypothetical protein
MEVSKLQLTQSEIAKTLRIVGLNSSFLYISEKADIQWEEEKEIFLGILMKYQLEGRYPDFNPTTPSVEDAYKNLSQTKEITKWLQNKL